MELSELHGRPGLVLALAEQVCPSLNGPASFRLSRLLESVASGYDLDELDDLVDIVSALRRVEPARLEHWQNALTSFDGVVVTVLDDPYPANLRMIHDRPPFLFVRGTLTSLDDRAVAVVGTREPSEEGLAAAHHFGRTLASHGITVVSGLATGIDTAAHSGALSAGGRTIAVFGTGINRVYPAANRQLATAITKAGAVVSQFWPDMAPTKWSFPVRNIVTSGLSVATVVVEAGATSGARLQAEHAVKHGKRLFLLEHLLEQQQWARDMLALPGVAAITGVDEVLDGVATELDLVADIGV